MELDNFFKVCVYFSISLMVFTLSLNFLTGLGIFGPLLPGGGMDVTGNQSQIVGNFTSTPSASGGFGDVWLLVFGLGTAAGIGGAIVIAMAMVLPIWMNCCWVAILMRHCGSVTC